MRIYLLPLLCLLLFSCAKKGQNLTESTGDSQAYPKVTLDTLHQNFDVLVQETSGLMNINNTFWTNNDSGGEPSLYQFDIESGKVIRTVEIAGVQNIDWEELASDSVNFYIGNFGNNLGKRKDLVIYKGLVEDLLTKDRVDVSEIKFSYPDQERYYNGYNHNHDCEAMIVSGDRIYLFSKNWGDMHSKLYSLPTKPGEYDAELISRFNTQGVITAADISVDGDKLVLLGYTGSPQRGFDPFIWKIMNWNDEDFFSGEKSRYMITTRRQMEGITFENDKSLLISSEDESGSHPALYRMHL